MEDGKKTRKQLTEEINELRNRVAELKGFGEEIRQTRINHEKFTKAFLQNSVPASITTLKEGRFLDVSNVFLRLTGYKRDEIIGHTSTECGLITEEQRASFFNELNKRGRIENLEMRVRTKGGALRDGLFNAVMMSLSNEKYLLAVITDITERKQAEEALRKSEGKYRSLIENINDGIYILDSSGKFTFVNDVIVERSGYPTEWFLARSYLNVISEKDRNRVKGHFKTVMEGKTQVYDLSYLDKSGNLIHVEVSTAPLFDDGEVIGLLGISRNITDRKRMEEELINQHRQLEKSVKERTADLEIKTRMHEDINVALKVLLQQRDEERRDMEDQFVANIKTLILPYINKMKHDGLGPRPKACLSIMESNIHELISPFTHSIRHHNFTPKEMIVASLIRDGKTTKDIAKMMEVGTSAIDSHRNRIRKKLGLREKRKINLQSYLSVLK